MSSHASFDGHVCGADNGYHGNVQCVVMADGDGGDGDDRDW